MPRFRLFKPLQSVSDDMLNLDALRFLAALGVVGLHAAHHLDFGPDWGEKDVEPLRLVVDLFFMISGYVMGAVYSAKIGTPSQIGRFLKTRFFRLYPLHLLMLIAFIVIGAVGKGESGHAENYDASCIPANLLMIQAWGGCSHLTYNGASWSISAEMLMYLLFPAFAWLSARSRAAILTLGLLAAGILTVATGFGQHPWWYWMTPFGAVRAFPSFLLGLSIWNYREKLASLPAAQPIMWLLIVVFVVGIGMKIPPFVLLLDVWAIVTLAAASDQNRGADPLMRSLSPLGALTYASYMIHSLVFIGIITLIVEHHLHSHGVEKNGIVFATILLTFGMAWPIENIFDEIKRVALKRFR